MPAPISATMWSPPAEAGTLTGSPRVSDLPTTAQPAGPKRAFTSAILVALGIVCVVAAGLIGSLAFPGRTPKTTVSAAIPAAVAPDDPAPPSTPPLPATAVAIEPSTVASPPVKTSAPAATTAPSGKATPVAAPPIVVPPIKSSSRLPPAPPPKKANPALGF